MHDNLEGINSIQWLESHKNNKLIYAEWHECKVKIYQLTMQMSGQAVGILEKTGASHCNQSFLEVPRTVGDL